MSILKRSNSVFPRVELSAPGLRLDSGIADPAYSVVKAVNASDKTRPCRRGYVGRGSRYRLGEVSYGLYLSRDNVPADIGDRTAPRLDESLGLAIEGASEDWRVFRPTKSNSLGNSITPSFDGGRYWFGIARGQRKAKELMMELDIETHVQYGWPIYWTSCGAYLFKDRVDRPYYKDYQPARLPSGGRSADFLFFSTDEAIKYVGDSAFEYDHLGEFADIPKWTTDTICKDAS